MFISYYCTFDIVNEHTLINISAFKLETFVVKNDLDSLKIN